MEFTGSRETGILEHIGKDCGCLLKGPDLIVGAGSHGKRMGAGLSLSSPTPRHFLSFFSSFTAISEKDQDLKIMIFITSNE